MKISNNHGIVISLQADNALVVTPSDSTDLSYPSTLYVGGTGDIKVTMVGTGTEIVFSNAQKGSTLPILVTRVWATGTTATNIIALW